jgi:cytochrome c oxidase subunit 2
VRRASILQLVLIGAIAGGIATAVAIAVPWLPEWAGKEGERIGFVFWFTTIICIAIFALVAAVSVYALWKFRAPEGDDSDGPPIHGHTGLEIAWTAVPAVLVTAISIVSAIVLAQNSHAGERPLVVKVVAQQFAWQFEYPGGKTFGQLRLPVGRHVRLEITAKDVIHSFWVPELAQKQDAVPDQINPLVVTPTRTGTFSVICTELCGIGHAIMRTSALVMPAAEFDAWLKSNGGAGATGGGAAAGGGSGSGASGLAVFKTPTYGCTACHTMKAAGSTGQIGPDLDNLSAPAKEAGKPLEEFVRESIVDPAAYIAKGYDDAMPHNFGETIPPKDLDALVQFLVKESQ